MNTYLKWAASYRTYSLTGKQFAEQIFLPTYKITRKQAAQMIDRFHREFPQVKLWQKLQHQPHCD